MLEKNPKLTDDELKGVITNPIEIKEIIKKLHNNKAPGIDRVDNILIKNLLKKVVVQLMYIINPMLKTHYYPRQ